MPKLRLNVSTTWSPSSLRMRPVSTNTQVSWWPMALWTSAAATAESTPPESPQMARPSPTCARISSTWVSMTESIVQVGRAAARLVQEVLEQVLAVRRVHDLGVELHAVQAPLGRLEGGGGRVGRGAHHLEAVRRPGDGVEVAHPDDLLVGEVVVEQQRPRRGPAQVGPAVLAPSGLGHLAAEVAGQQLSAVADAQDRHARVVDAGIDRRRALGVHRRRTPREDDALGVPLADLVGGDVVGHDLGVDVGLAHPAGDELGVLGAEVDDQDGVELGGDGLGGREVGAAHAQPRPSGGDTISSAFWNSLRLS